MNFNRSETPSPKLPRAIMPGQGSTVPDIREKLGTFVFLHNRYKLGDTVSTLAPETFLRKATDEGWIVKPIFMQYHTGVPSNTAEHSGQIGWIYAIPERVKKVFGCQRITQRVKDLVEATLDAEATELNRYVADAVLNTAKNGKGQVA